MFPGFSSPALLFSFSLVSNDHTFPQRSLVNVNLSDLCSVSLSVSFPSLLICTNAPIPKKKKNPCSLKPFARRLMYDLFEIDSPTRSWFVDESVCDLPVSWFYLISGGSGKHAAWGRYMIHQRSIDNSCLVFKEESCLNSFWRTDPYIHFTGYYNLLTALLRYVGKLGEIDQTWMTIFIYIIKSLRFEIDFDDWTPSIWSLNLYTRMKIDGTGRPWSRDTMAKWSQQALNGNSELNLPGRLWGSGGNGDMASFLAGGLKPSRSQIKWQHMLLVRITAERIFCGGQTRTTGAT